MAEPAQPKIFNNNIIIKKQKNSKNSKGHFKNICGPPHMFFQ
jgi:hypothetical protein